tara:strand:- start:323 stop:505 length:183 start_codon:yes stop_codon:yes gene_type:complete
MAIFSKNLSISKALLDELKTSYPDRLPSQEITLEELRYLQGQQSIIQKLESLFEETLEEE